MIKYKRHHHNWPNIDSVLILAKLPHPCTSLAILHPQYASNKLDIILHISHMQREYLCNKHYKN